MYSVYIQLLNWIQKILEFYFVIFTEYSINHSVSEIGNDKHIIYTYIYHVKIVVQGAIWNEIIYSYSTLSAPKFIID